MGPLHLGKKNSTQICSLLEDERDSRYMGNLHLASELNVHLTMNTKSIANSLHLNPEGIEPCGPRLEMWHLFFIAVHMQHSLPTHMCP